MDKEYDDFEDELLESSQNIPTQQNMIDVDVNRDDTKYKNIDELETYVIKCLLTSQTLISRFIDKLKLSYFQSKSNRVIYKMIQTYYKEMNFKIPQDEIALRLEDILPKNNIEDKNKDVRTECILTINRLLAEPPINQESAGKNISNFIIKRASEEALNELINNITNTEGNEYEDKQYYAIEKCVAKIRESTSLQIEESEPFNLSDVHKIPEIRKEGLGEGSSSIKFFLESLNDTLQYDGINIGALVCVMAAPGTGKTTFLTNQGLFSAMQGLHVCYCYIGDMEKIDSLIRNYSIYMESDYRKIDVLNNSIEKKLMACKKLLKKQKEESEYYTRYSNNIKKYEEQLAENNKLNEAWKQNKIVLTSKQLASCSDEELMKIIGNDKQYLEVAKNIDAFIYPVASITMDALREEIYNWQKQKNIHYDVIIIDYDANLKQPADNLYESGGIIYDQAKNLAQVNKSVVFIASQPNKAFWKNELIPLEACSESSKKQMIIDLLITMGRPEGVNTGIRKIYIPKNRRGKENEILHAKMNGDTGFMYEIQQEEYERLKKEGYDPTLIITAAGMYGNKKKKEDQDSSSLVIENQITLPGGKIIK